ncbi:GntR family transcriptional regulator [Lactobacillus sp. YT155]|uniref:GntR family transcriptional regulator n=1 Tax=Lactobacillus sp. YT155 TaxID=3060955 RepID=UPI00265F8DDC|nr:GntR family transcriptional regulator [Lactobacillus sp. YT155]MDO1604677.1 GntR family transcriptional regulator [Lactobacillus sp. YT155]
MKKYLFEEIAKDITSRIQRNEYKPGMMIPSETELQKLFSASRSTVRKALDILVNNNLIIKKNGIGAYVKPKITSQNILNMVGIIKSDHVEGRKEEIKEFFVRTAGDYYGELLNLKSNELVYSIKLIRIEKDNNKVLEYFILPLDYFTNLKQNDLQLITTLELINSSTPKLFSVVQTLKIMNATDDLSKHLSVQVDAPIFKLSSTYFSKDGKPIAVVRRYEDALSTGFKIDFS